MTMALRMAKLLILCVFASALVVKAEPIPWGGGEQGGSWGGQERGGGGGGWNNGRSSAQGGGWGPRNTNNGAGQGGGWGGRNGGGGGGAELRSPDGRLYGGNLIQEPDRYGYEANIPGAMSHFYGYRSGDGRSGSFGRNNGQENGPHSQNYQGAQGRQNGWGR